MTEMKATCTIQLNERTKELFKLMNFHEIPEGATYVAFLEDGDATFVEGELEFVKPEGPGIHLPRFPHMTMISYHTDVVIQFDD
jgi:hypothetical protein